MTLQAASCWYRAWDSSWRVVCSCCRSVKLCSITASCREAPGSAGARRDPSPGSPPGTHPLVLQGFQDGRDAGGRGGFGADRVRDWKKGGHIIRGLRIPMDPRAPAPPLSLPSPAPTAQLGTSPPPRQTPKHPGHRHSRPRESRFFPRGAPFPFPIPIQAPLMSMSCSSDSGWLFTGSVPFSAMYFSISRRSYTWLDTGDTHGCSGTSLETAKRRDGTGTGTGLCPVIPR